MTDANKDKSFLTRLQEGSKPIDPSLDGVRVCRKVIVKEQNAISVIHNALT